MKKVIAVLFALVLSRVALLLAPCVAWADITLWPGDRAATLAAQPSSTLAFDAQGVALVATDTHYTWPGVRLDFSPPRDLSAFGTLVFALSNRTARAITVWVSVKCDNCTGQSPGDSVTLPPYAASRLSVDLSPMPWHIDAPVTFRGMNGYPTSPNVAGGAFDVTKVASVHIFVSNPRARAAFAVRTVTASGFRTPPKHYKARTFFPFVDAYGQFKHDDWPGKVHGADDLKRQAIAERRWLDAQRQPAIPDCDAYGGWTKGPQLRATGFFRTEKVRGTWWLVDPAGNLFFSHGVTCVRSGREPTGVTYRENYFENLPARSDPSFGRFYGLNRYPAAKNFYSATNHCPYVTYNFAAANMLRKYGPDWEDIVKRLTHERLHAWGLNTVANWSLPAIYLLRKTPYTVTIDTGGAPRLEKSDGWWGKLPDPFHPKFEQILRVRARQMAKTMKDDPWCLGVFVDNELSWNHACDLSRVANAYFEKVARIVHEELPNHLYLGSRIAGGPDETLAIAAKYCDVVSVNVYRRAMQRDLPPGSVDKPMINGEFHFGALDRGMFHTGLVAAKSQADRAACYKRYVYSCLDHPRVVGTHWFQWQDQALTGRPDGENYQIGFLNVVDAPHAELVRAAREIGRTMYARRFAR